MVIKIKDTELDFYDNPSNLPVVRYYEYQFYLTLCIATDLNHVSGLISSVEEKVITDKKEDALNVLQNIRVGFALSFQKIDPKTLCVGQLLKSINGRRVDFTNNEDGLKEKVAELSKLGLNYNHIESVYDTVKKKFEQG